MTSTIEDDMAGDDLRGTPWQPSLLDVDAATTHDPRLSFLQRIPLDESSWIDFLPSWVHGGDALLAALVQSAPWQPQRMRTMWDNYVAEPRIIASWPDLATLPSAIEDMRLDLSRAYDTDFDRVAVNLYRDGRDSVAWHADRVRFTHDCPLVATVSIGARRTFRLRPEGGGPSALTLDLGAGDLVVMGGRCQHDFLHAVLKTRRTTGARMSLTFRHSGPAATGDGLRA